MRFCPLLNARGQFRTTLWVWSRWLEEEEGKKGVFFLLLLPPPPPPPLHFRKAENDLSKVMIKGYVMDGFVLLCLSIFQSFPSLTFLLFLFSGDSHYFHHPPHFSQIQCISPYPAKGKEKPSCSNFISSPAHTVFGFWGSFVSGGGGGVCFLFILWNYSVIFLWVHSI